MMLAVKLTCPKCGSQSALKDFNPSDEVIEIARLAAKFGNRWPWVEQYLMCFQTSADKPLTPSRVRLYLEELLEFIEKKGFSAERQWHAIRPEAIFEAIRHVAQTGKMGFKNHNYLKKVAIDINSRMVKKEESESLKKESENMLRQMRDPKGPERIGEILKKLQ